MKRLIAVIGMVVLALGVFSGCGISQIEEQSLLEFKAAKDGVKGYDLSRAVQIQTYANHCEYGEATQYIDDADRVAASVKAVSAMRVVGTHDNISSTGTYYVYRFCDADGDVILSFAIQDEMLMEDDGRYTISGVKKLRDEVGAEYMN